MSPNTTLFQAFPSPQPNSTTTDVLVIIVFGIASTAVTAFIICHGHRTWRIWRLNGNRMHDEEDKLGNFLTTDAGNGNSEEHELGNVSTIDAEIETLEKYELGRVSTTDAGSHVNNVSPTRGRPQPPRPSAPTLNGGSMNHVELDAGDDEGAWP